nr:MAG TPA: hypothetical protein [Caudoviricetes sp.]
MWINEWFLSSYSTYRLMSTDEVKLRLSMYR